VVAVGQITPHLRRGSVSFPSSPSCVGEEDSRVRRVSRWSVSLLRRERRRRREYIFRAGWSH
jgi:hypothetical protein